MGFSYHVDLLQSLRSFMLAAQVQAAFEQGWCPIRWVRGDETWEPTEGDVEAIRKATAREEGSDGLR